MRKTLSDKLENSIVKAIQVMSFTKPINMFRATKWDPVVIVQKM